MELRKGTASNVSAMDSQLTGVADEKKPLEAPTVVRYPVKRVGGEYLPEKMVTKTQHDKADETFFGCIKSAVLGGFLTLTGAKDNVGSECANIGLVSALMLTIIVPMSYESLSDWLEEDYVGSGFAFAEGYIGEKLSEAQIGNALPWLHDVSLFFYAVGICGFLSSTVASICMLLCISEVSTDAGCAEWLRVAGVFTRAPYLLFLAGTFFMWSVLIRWLLAVKTLAGLVCLSCVCLAGYLFMVVVCLVYIRSCIKAHNRIHEFEGLHLSHSEAQEDVEAWWKQNATIDGTLEDCLDALAGKLTHPNLVINLDGISKERVAMHYHKLRTESIGITLSPSELYQLCLQHWK